MNSDEFNKQIREIIESERRIYTDYHVKPSMSSKFFMHRLQKGQHKGYQLKIVDPEEWKRG